MHELSIAHELVESADAAARRAGASRVIAVYLRLGKLSGVVSDALHFGYDITTKGTLLEGSRLVIEALPVVIYCDVCRREVELPGIQSFDCPHCGTPSRHIRQGKEMEIRSMEVEMDAALEPLVNP